MNAIGIFAGRGDVLVAMALAGLVGVYLGWYARKYSDRIRGWMSK